MRYGRENEPIPLAFTNTFKSELKSNKENIFLCLKNRINAELIVIQCLESGKNTFFEYNKSLELYQIVEISSKSSNDGVEICRKVHSY